MQSFLQWVLKIISHQVVRKYNPKIIGITGSVGKSSAKEAIFAVLKNKFKVRCNIKNYNNELGVPLTILGKESGGSSLIKWLGIIFSGLGLLFKHDKNYPEILILEMGADKPGDITYLTNLAHCDVGVLTAIGTAHLEAFKSLKKVTLEKQIIITHLKKNGFAILNADDDVIATLTNKTDAEVIKYGIEKKADVTAVAVKIIDDATDGQIKIRGINFKINYRGSFVPVMLPCLVGEQHVYAALAGAAVGVSFGMNLVEISAGLKNYNPPPSRMRILDGTKYTTIIDDSYNSSPVAAFMALDVLAHLRVAEGARRIAVLGDMLELGSDTEPAHRDVGQRVVELGIDYLVAVGESGKIIARAALEKGMNKENVVTFNNSEEAGKFLQDKVEPEDLLLIKGSQGARMEKIVVALMAEPQDAKTAVCRHDTSWSNK